MYILIDHWGSKPEVYETLQEIEESFGPDGSENSLSSDVCYDFEIWEVRSPVELVRLRIEAQKITKGEGK